MQLPRHECVNVPIPINTVIKLTPTSSGCEQERFVLLEPPGEPPGPAGCPPEPSSH